MGTNRVALGAIAIGFRMLAAGDCGARFGENTRTGFAAFVVSTVANSFAGSRLSAVLFLHGNACFLAIKTAVPQFFAAVAALAVFLIVDFTAIAF